MMELEKIVGMHKVQVLGSAKYIAIPKDICDGLRIQKGDKLIFSWDGEESTIKIQKVGG